MTQERVKGFIVGSDNVAGKVIWKVRADRSYVGPEAGKKFKVASFETGIDFDSLKPGLNVDFELFKVGNEIKARSVRVIFEAQVAAQRSAEDDDEGAMRFMVTRMGEDGPVSVCYTVNESPEAALAEIRSAGSDDENVVDFITITPSILQKLSVIGFDEDVLGMVESLFRMDNTVQALEGILTAVYRAGLNRNSLRG